MSSFRRWHQIWRRSDAAEHRFQLKQQWCSRVLLSVVIPAMCSQLSLSIILFL
jgi:hypothetical protein